MTRITRPQSPYWTMIPPSYPGTFCRLVAVKEGARQLRLWRMRNRLYYQGNQNGLYRVPNGWGSAQMSQALRRGRLFLLADGMF